MGVPRFFRQIAESLFPTAIKKFRPTDKVVSDLLIDANGLAHRSAMKVYKYGEYAHEAEKIKGMSEEKLNELFFRQVYTDISDMVDKVLPSTRLVIAFDGIIPKAKMIQQKQRRFRGLDKKVEDNKQKSAAGTFVFDNTQISPGTVLMKKLDAYLRMALENNKRNLPKNILYSGWDSYGEGEHKIFDLLREEDAKKDTYYVLEGLDADLFFLSLLHDSKNIILMKEVNHARPGESPVLEDIFVDISACRKTLIEKTGNEHAHKSYVLGMFFNGNDFVIPAPSMFDVKINSFLVTSFITQQGGFFDKSGKFSGKKFNDFFSFISEHEAKLTLARARRMSTDNKIRNVSEIKGITDTVFKSGDLYPRNFFEDRIRPLPVNNENLKKIEPSLADYKEVARAAEEFQQGESESIMSVYNNYYTSKFGDIPYDKVCEQFIQNILWCYNYYTKGLKGVDAGWFYPYHYSPFISMVECYINAEETPIVPVLASIPRPVYYSYLHQLCYILPPISLSNALSDSKLLAKFFPFTTAKLVEVEDDIRNRDHSIVLSDMPGILFDLSIQAVKIPDGTLAETPRLIIDSAGNNDYSGMYNERLRALTKLTENKRFSVHPSRQPHFNRDSKNIGKPKDDKYGGDKKKEYRPRHADRNSYAPRGNGVKPKEYIPKPKLNSIEVSSAEPVKEEKKKRERSVTPPRKAPRSPSSSPPPRKRNRSPSASPPPRRAPRSPSVSPPRKSAK